MKAQNTLTFIISKNYGHPISLSLPVWRVYLGALLLAGLLGGMLLMSVLFLGTYPRLLMLERERDELKSERDALREQVLSANQKYFDLKEERIVLASKAAGARRGKSRPDPSEEGLASEYLPPIQITSIKTRVDRKTVEVVFRIASQGDPIRNRGGFLIAVFENTDVQPARFATSPAVEVNAEGFPATYKTGVRFPRVRTAVTYRRKVRRKSQEEYFTHVTLYLFSLRGGLLVKDRFELERDLFTRAAAYRAPAANLFMHA
jgi:hypothetical protein